MENKHIIIYGGSSEISQELFGLLKDEFNEFTIFCRNKKKVEAYTKENKSENIIINIVEIDLLDLEKNYACIEKIENKISGIIWVSGVTGNPQEEILNQEICEKNIRINFLNPVLFINTPFPSSSPFENSPTYIPGSIKIVPNPSGKSSLNSPT